MFSGSMRPEFSSTTFSWRAKNGDGPSEDDRRRRQCVDNGPDRRCSHLFEQVAVFGNIDERSACAQPETSDSTHRDVGEPTFDDGLRQRVDDTLGAEREAARRLAHVGAGPYGTVGDHAVLS